MEELVHKVEVTVLWRPEQAVHSMKERRTAVSSGMKGRFYSDDKQDVASL